MNSMQSPPLSIPALLQYSAINHPDAPIVSSVAGVRHEHRYPDILQRALSLAGALRRHGIQQGDRVATLAWNDFRHLELYFAPPGLGAVTHTINPRLTVEQLKFVLNHAADRILFVDPDFAPLVGAIAAAIPTVELVVVLADRLDVAIAGKTAVSYEEFISSAMALEHFETVGELTPAGLCYTSGTTGHPKGVLYTHRSTVLHAFAACSANGLGFSSLDTVMPIVPMFHANAWGTPYACAMAGSALVLPGGRLDAASLHALIVRERVSFAAGIPTIWARLLDYVDEQKLGFGSLTGAGIGGSAPTMGLLERLRARGLTPFHGWGMTETSPLGGTGRARRGDAQQTAEQQLALQLTQGRELYGLERRVVNDQGQTLPRDGRSAGKLQVRGHWVVDRYFDSDDTSHLDHGWFDTGDVATLDALGRLRIVDRAKDLIKSGGEWISSIELETLASLHPEVMEAAAIAIDDPKWGERPKLIVKLRPGTRGAADTEQVVQAIRNILKKSLAAWQIPDVIEVVDALPYGATGKIDKKQLRSANQ